MLARLHLHEDGLQILGEHVLMEREEVYPVIWPPGYMTTSRVERWGIRRLNLHWVIQSKWENSRVPAGLRMIFFRIWTSLLLQTGSPVPWLSGPTGEEEPAFFRDVVSSGLLML